MLDLCFMKFRNSLFLVFLCILFNCGEGTASQTDNVDVSQEEQNTNNLIVESSDTSVINEQSPQGPEGGPSPEYCKENQDDPACQRGPQGPQGPEGGPSSERIEEAIGIVETASPEVEDCIKSGIGDIFDNILSGYEPDDYEVNIIIGCEENPGSVDRPTPKPGKEGKSESDYYSLTVTLNNSTYSQAVPSSNSTFGLNEEADMILSDYGFNETGGALKLNHPVSVASDGIRLAISDRFNNRVLIWNSIPESNVSPDLVLGQKNFNTEMEGSSLDKFDFPGQLSITKDGKLLVADSQNHRILIWTTFPTSSGQAADIELDIARASNFKGPWPWGVWSDGTKVMVTATTAKKILVWNSFPQSGLEMPDVTIESSVVGTPRSITSNGQYVMIGDENASGECSGINGSRSTHVWTSWPTSSRNPDACVDNWVGGVIVENNIYTIAAGGESLYFWNTLPSTTSELKSGEILALPGEGHKWQGGDDGGIAYANGKLFIGEYNASRVTVFNSLPASPSVKPDWAIGASSTTNFPLYDEFIIQNGVIASNGKMLFVSSDFDRSLSVWKKLPGSIGAKPDIFYKRFAPDAPWDLTVHGDSVFLGGGRSIYGWESFDGSGEFPEIEWQSIGSVSFDRIMGIAYNGSYFVVADETGNKIYVWNGIPSSSQEPMYTLNNPSTVGRIDMDNEWLVISGKGADDSVHVIKISDFGTSSFRPIPYNTPFPQGVSINEKGFFIAVQGEDRVIGWSTVEEAITGSQPTMSFGGNADKSRSGTKMASTVGWDGVHLWVGEFKFSNRILGFLPSK